MSTLILFLPLAPRGPATDYSYTLTADGHTALAQASAPATLLPEPSRPGGEVVAVVPAQALSWQRVQLPLGVPLGTSPQTARLRSVLEGLLEDQLLDEPAQLHFALQPGARAGEPVWVAVCDRHWLREALQALEAAGRRVARVVPEFTPGPTASGGPELHALGTPEEARLVLCGHGADQGVAVLPLSSVALGLIGTPPAGADSEEAATPVRAEPAVAALAEHFFQRPVTLQQRGERLLQAASTPWELAQFEFTQAQRDPGWASLARGIQSFWRAPAWRPARWALVLLLLGNVVGLNAWAWRTQADLSAQRRAVQAVLTDTFPKIPVVVDAPLQMAREVAVLARASGAAAGGDLERILSSFSALAPAGYVPDAIEFAANELRLSGAELSLPEQARIVTGLQAQGLSASGQGKQWLIRAGGAP